MKAMIFAAGLGSRLMPITKDKPKALAIVAEKSLLERAINYISDAGFTDIIINTHHFSEKIIEFLNTHHFDNVNISLSYEVELLDTAGGLAQAKYFFDSDEDILLYNVDIITNLDLQKFINFHKFNHADISLAVRNRNTSRYFLFNQNNRLVGWRNKLTFEEIIYDSNSINLNELAFSGIHIISPKILNLLGKIKKWSLTTFYLEIASSQKILAYQDNNSYWFDCGKIETLNAASEYLKKIDEKN
ncbi:MAG: hypothetical protein AUJ98_07285 [Bacteroidetes bacterium CG2_30_33_31]|nr:MAG: hypothetical protein AUJ98_07285 [Bacteroidetes bacterium CG2_30_33_31]